jgi:hypothetical protein
VGKNKEGFLMASGNFVLSGLNTTLVATDNSCKSVMKAIDLHYWGSGTNTRRALACSSDPVLKDSKVFSSTSASAATSQTVQTMNATPFKKMDWFDTAHLIQALIIVGFVMMFVRGFDSGNKL